MAAGSSPQGFSKRLRVSHHKATCDYIGLETRHLLAGLMDGGMSACFAEEFVPSFVSTVENPPVLDGSMVTLNQMIPLSHDGTHKPGMCGQGGQWGICSGPPTWFVAETQHNDDGTPLKITYVSPGSWIAYRKFVYNANGSLAESHYYRFSDGDTKLLFQTSVIYHYDAGGTLQKAPVTIDSDGDGVVDHEYDATTVAYLGIYVPDYDDYYANSADFFCTVDVHQQELEPHLPPTITAFPIDAQVYHLTLILDETESQFDSAILFEELDHEGDRVAELPIDGEKWEALSEDPEWSGEVGTNEDEAAVARLSDLPEELPAEIATEVAGLASAFGGQAEDVTEAEIEAVRPHGFWLPRSLGHEDVKEMMLKHGGFPLDAVIADALRDWKMAKDRRS